MINEVFIDIGIIIIIATITAFLARRFRQPLIPAYILAGLLIGPGLQYLLSIESFTNLFHLHPSYSLISNESLIRTLSEIGIAFLLFMVGLEIDLKKLKDVEKVSVLGGSIQVLLLFVIAFIFQLKILIISLQKQIKESGILLITTIFMYLTY